ncbi:MAG: LAGLIDADG family homing endonuclease [Nonlabens sp.]|jgi:hypothetical protein|uniref:LAGLIDADG family homing endonuclease n=1 Tax=Nonlabens sp. TaxID=1888209 RepID=UPI00321B5675|tara:strand:- start:96 stop:488 length:393 start_codon:yes stop_codon:yes gene_type:complete
MTEAEAAYIAGLFDGEGTITYKKYKEKKRNGIYDCWRISMEIAMTDRSVLVWLTEVLGCGTLNKKPRKNGHKMQYRWRCVFRDCFHVCCLLFPYAHVKLGKIQQVIEHYSTIEKKDNVVNFEHYKMWIKN